MFPRGNPWPSLRELSNQKQFEEIPTRHLLQAALTSLFIGSFDLHGDNLHYVFDPSQKSGFKFFDNTRSFPHSNGIINWGGELWPAFRSGLLELPQCYSKLNEQDLLWLQEESSRLLETLPFIQTFLTEKEEQKRPLPTSLKIGST